MIVGVRRVFAGVAVAALLSLGGGFVPALAETPAATPSATADATVTPTGATATPTTSSEVSVTTEPDSESPDVAPDNSRNVLAIGGAAVLALLAAVLVFLRRR